MSNQNHTTWVEAWAQHEKAQGAKVKKRPWGFAAIYPDETREFCVTPPTAKQIKDRESKWPAEAVTWTYRWTHDEWNRLNNDGELRFHWSRPVKQMVDHQRPVFLHHNDRLFEVSIWLLGKKVMLRFTPGERDKYGPVAYGSKPAPFDVKEAS